MSIAIASIGPAADYRGSWAMKVTGSWPASAATWAVNAAHPDFPLDPSATPKVVLTVTSAPGKGWTRAGGEAVLQPQTRRVVATMPVRLPFPGSTETVSRLDEVDEGNGMRSVWLALSSPVYAGESVTADFLADWRTGLPADFGIAVLNQSDRAYPLPIVAWATPGMKPVLGPGNGRVDLLVASHFPRHFGAMANQAVAAVRYDISDGTRSSSVWVTGESASPDFGDGLRCWGVDLWDHLAGLNPGTLFVTATIYPWFGDPRVLDVAPTAQSGARIAFHTNPDRRLGIWYDPAETYARRFVHVDAAVGSSVASAVTVANSLAAAKAGTAAASVSVAIQAMYVANYTLPAQNGQSSVARAMPYWTVVLAPGDQVMGSQTVTSGASAGPGYLRVVGDPDDPDPRAHCRLLSPASPSPILRVSTFLLEDLTLALGDNSLNMTCVWGNRVTIKPRAGASSTGNFFATSAPSIGIGNLFLTDFVASAYGPINGGSVRPMLLRHGVVAAANASGAQTAAKVLVNLEAVRHPTRTYSSGSTPVDFEHWAFAGDETTDNVAWNLKSLHCNGRFLDLGADPSGTSTFRRTAVVNCLAARANANRDTGLGAIGENGNSKMVDCIWEGVTFVGQRMNWHNDPVIATDNLVQHGIVLRNAYMDRNATKHDTFPVASGNRTGHWPVLFGVDHAAIVYGERLLPGSTDFQRQFYGLHAVRAFPTPGNPSISIAQFVDDQSNWGPHAIAGVGPGGGDYRPAPGSPLLGMAVPACTDADLAGHARGLVFDAGAVGAAAAPVAVPLVVEQASHALIGSSAVLAVAPLLRAAPAVHAMIGVSPDLAADGPPLPPMPAADPVIRVHRVRAERRTREVYGN